MEFDICDVKTSISKKTKDPCLEIAFELEIISSKPGQITCIIKGNILRKYFESIDGLVPSSRPFLTLKPASVTQ